MRLISLKNNIEVLLVPNYRVFRITVIYNIGDGFEHKS